MNNSVLRNLLNGIFTRTARAEGKMADLDLAALEERVEQSFGRLVCFAEIFFYVKNSGTRLTTAARGGLALWVCENWEIIFLMDERLTVDAVRTFASLLRECFPRHVTLIASRLAAGIKEALGSRRITLRQVHDLFAMDAYARKCVGDSPQWLEVCHAAFRELRTRYSEVQLPALADAESRWDALVAKTEPNA